MTHFPATSDTPKETVVIIAQALAMLLLRRVLCADLFCDQQLHGALDRNAHGARVTVNPPITVQDPPLLRHRLRQIPGG